MDIAVIGMGYVGLPLAYALSKKHKVTGFDISPEKIDLYKRGVDPTNEIGDEAVKSSSITFTSSESDLRDNEMFIVAVPTPINRNKLPDLTPVIAASEIVGRNISKGSIVVFESTVYPGVTEEVCGPILERVSGLRSGIDLKLGYSPERINPGDREHTVEKILKIVAGQDDETLEIIAEVYGSVIEAGVYRAPSIRVAEAAKVIENTQRDLNIAFMNELSLIFSRMGIDTKEVLKAAGTKWNFLKFSPGLVGGHCIGVDPYYLTYKAQELGYHPQVILAGRKINDDMGFYVAEQTIKQLIKAGKNVNGARVNVLGITFKENVPDVRNSRVVDIVRELLEFGVDVSISDPCASERDANEEYGFGLTCFEDLPKADAVILAVPHKEYLDLGIEGFKKMFRNKNGVLIDVKYVLDRKDFSGTGIHYWSL
ncbi:MAG: nucleotide sugar dehydrogenase [Candidatus Thermoplasmatota archaeon]|nr:nucleotide sugar dehydrogenase [Candidatus Thermoplasmatota archaeon]